MVNMSSARQPLRRRQANLTMGGVIGELRGRFVRDEGFRVTTNIRPGSIGPLTGVLNGVDFSHRREVVKDEGNIAVVVSRTDDGSIKEGAVGEGKRVTVKEILALMKRNSPIPPL